MKKSVSARQVFVLITVGLVFCLSSCTGTGGAGGEDGNRASPFLEDLGNGICLQHPQGLMWQAGMSPVFANWEDADAYVKSLNLGEYEDWRLPTPDECLRLSELVRMKAGDCPIETGGNHWVSKTRNIEAGQWENSVYCDGPIFRWTKDKKGTVKAVRP